MKRMLFFLSLNRNLCAKKITDYSKGQFADAGLQEFIFFQILIVADRWEGFPVVLSAVLITAFGFARTW